jgi:hypothetical protein
LNLFLLLNRPEEYEEEEEATWPAQHEPTLSIDPLAIEKAEKAEKRRKIEAVQAGEGQCSS